MSERKALFKFYIKQEQALQMKLFMPASASPVLAKKTVPSTIKTEYKMCKVVPFW